MRHSKWKDFLNEEVNKIYVHGYIKPENAFHTLSEWREFVDQVLKFQKEGYYVSHGHGKVVLRERV